MSFLKVSTAADIIVGPFVDSTDGVTAETALTISQADIRLSKNGAAFAQTNNATGATHRENGHYLIPLDSTDTNTVGRLRVAVNESGALPCWRDFDVLPAVVYDSLVGGTDNLQVDTVQFNGSNVTALSGRPEVNTTHAAGTAWGSGAITAASIASDAITSAKIADGAIDTATFASGCTIPRCTLVDTTTTNADMINAGGIRSAVGLASASLDTQLSAIAGYIDTEVATVISQTTAASIRSAVGLASANLDTQLTTIDDFLDTEINAIKAKTDLIPSDPADASDIAALIDALPTAAEIWDLPDGVEAGLTPRGAFRLCTSALVGKVSGAAGTTVVFRNVGDTKNRISATVDADGNRSAVTTDAT